MKEVTEHEDDGDTNSNWHTWNSPQILESRTRLVGNPRSNGDHPNYSSLDIGQNTGDLKRLAVTQFP